MRALLILAFLLTAALRADPGVAVVDSMAGEVSVSPQSDLGLREAFDPVGAEFQTGSSSFAVIVFSNGVSIYLEPNTTLRIDAFEQQPFEARPDDFEFEPSRSQLTITLSAGKIGVAQRDPNPSSKFIVEVGDGVSMDLKTKRSAVLNQGPELGVIAAILDGHGSMELDGDKLLCNEGYRLSSGVIDPNERVRLMTESQKEDWNTLAQKAQIALRRWYFQTPEAGGVTPVRVEPASFRSNKPYNNTKL